MLSRCMKYTHTYSTAMTHAFMTILTRTTLANVESVQVNDLVTLSTIQSKLNYNNRPKPVSTIHDDVFINLAMLV